MMDKRPFSKESIKKFEETKKKISKSKSPKLTVTKDGNPISAMPFLKKSSLDVKKNNELRDQLKSPSLLGDQFKERKLLGQEFKEMELPQRTTQLSRTVKLIASPRLESKFTSSKTIIQKSPQMQTRLIKEKESNLKILGVLSGKTPIPFSGNKNSIDTCSETSELGGDAIDIIGSSKVPVRNRFSNLGGKANFKESLNGSDDLKETPDSCNATGDFNNYEGYLYKITKMKKLKKLYFRLIHKDMYCKPLFIIIII